ncbi:hypothetical protein BGZ96_001162 [Linnemannia gamsii]|uniref:Alcohol dehydrogenase-like C-terminal domain-containing protein n=1 Tax=Linnemannia gamsii TaxID=64522 RepID=A0ABQ7K9C3_9FUNG|nr:hypothetical protein BGZ96_001162 [Linnemannia gamsii]
MECEECKAGQEQYCPKKTLIYNHASKDGCPTSSQGGFANRIRLCSEFVYQLPDEILFSHAAPLFCAGLTTFTGLYKCGAGPDKTVGVKGIGPLGHLAIQYAKAMGSKEVTTIIDSQVNAGYVAKLGATRCIDFSNEVHILAEHHKIDLLLVNSFDESTNWEYVLSIVSNHGTVVILALSKEPIRIPTMPFVHRDIKIVSSFQGGHKDVIVMLAFTAKHEIHPLIVKTTARYCIVLEADESKDNGSNAKAYKPVAEQYLKD